MDEKIEDESISKELKKFGKIKSEKVMMEEGRRKGFGFV